MQHESSTKTPSAQIAELPLLSMDQIWSLWDKYYPVRPKFPNRKYLEARIGLQIQVAAFGGLPESTRKRLEAIGSELSAIKTRTHMPKSKVEFAPGTQLIREWGGKQHQVTIVSANEYLYMGQSYKSLSAIANHITGTRWSGLLFFGLKNKTTEAEMP